MELAATLPGNGDKLGATRSRRLHIGEEFLGVQAGNKLGERIFRLCSGAGTNVSQLQQLRVQRDENQRQRILNS